MPTSTSAQRTTAVAMLAEQRQESVLSLVRSAGAVRVSELSSLLDVSEMTVRRDLAALERQGLLRRVHGGATAPPGGPADEPSFQLKAQLATDAKRAIARAALRVVQPGMTIALSAGTTTYALARELNHVPDLTVVTNSTDAANLLFDTLPKGSQVVLTGGVRTLSHALVGPVADASLRNLRVDVVFHGFHGMDPEGGFTCPNLAEVSTAQAMIAAGHRLVVLADHSKMGVIALAKVADLSAADILVTDAGISETALATLRASIYQVIVA